MATIAHVSHALCTLEDVVTLEQVLLARVLLHHTASPKNLASRDPSATHVPPFLPSVLPSHTSADRDLMSPLTVTPIACHPGHSHLSHTLPASPRLLVSMHLLPPLRQDQGWPPAWLPPAAQ